MREYETVIVLDPTLDESRVNQEIEAVGSVITQGGGEVVEIQNWGRRPLAYEVRKKREGIYSIIRFKSERGVLEELARRFKLNESLMRHHTVRYEGPTAPPSTDDSFFDDRREGRRRHHPSESVASGESAVGAVTGDRVSGAGGGADHTKAGENGEESPKAEESQ